jgi:hypothetical protein
MIESAGSLEPGLLANTDIQPQKGGGGTGPFAGKPRSYGVGVCRTDS